MIRMHWRCGGGRAGRIVAAQSCVLVACMAVVPWFLASSAKAQEAADERTTEQQAADRQPGDQPAATDEKDATVEQVSPEHAIRMAKGLEIFKQSVRPILVGRCVKCHGGEKTEGGLDLVDREVLLKGGASGVVVTPGSSGESRLYQLVAHLDEPAMPLDEERLSDEEIASIAAWIDNLAPYDAPLLGEDDKIAWTQRVVADDARSFWSFQPLRPGEPPAVRDTAWPRTPADRFVLARLEEALIAPNPPLGKERLIRRVYFDLLGLPPSPAEIAEFVNDTTDDAYSRLLDRLLASPRYGERWARHWLDVARFAESHGFEHDYDRPTAYHYRDFVIQALNRDLPYDTFVRWQLAGDEVAPDDNLALMATGFLAAGVHSTQITANEAERHRYDELDDMLGTVGTSMLGLTIGCARCHDHKFDPIPQRDYYQLLSAFTTVVRTEVELDMDPEGYRRAKKAFDAEHAPFVAALEAFERDELPARLAAWEAAGGLGPSRPDWVTLDLAMRQSEGGATFATLDDGSVRVEGTNPDREVLTFTATTELRGIRSIRLEALADPSLVKGGPGRADNGNFALTDFRVTAMPAGTDPAAAVPVALKDARATFEQSGLPVAAAIDDSDTSAWAVDPEFGKDHAAAFAVEGDVGFEGGTTLTFRLVFHNNVKHGLGRPRLSISTADEPPDLRGTSLPLLVAQALRKPAAERSAGEGTAILAWYRTIDPQWLELKQRHDEHLAAAPKPALAKALVSSEGLPPLRLHTQGADFLNETHFLRRGDANQKQGVAALGFLQVLMPGEDSANHWIKPPPSDWRTTYRRASLADWMTDVDRGAGALLARVIVNRLWQHHLGRGIVATPSDFGTRGERPTHPELLDWLAAELIRHDWRLKPIHKLIMQSAVYRQTADVDEARLAVDRENRLLWHWPRRRLEAEVVRDSLLAVSGTLDLTMFGPGTLDAASRRRSIYFTVKRSQLIPAMQVFDAPDGLQGIGERPTTTVAPQALYLMNNPQAREYSRAFARRVESGAADVRAQVSAAYTIALARQPAAEESDDAVAFIERQAADYQSAGQPDAGELALADFCQVLMCLNEFVYVD
jgi:mono/diheme cytochrome c family protein